jgi:membrane dipeptidase
VLIVDAHLDLAWNALQWNRDLTQSAYTIRTQEVAVPGPGRGQGTVSLPELRRGRVALCFGTTLARSTGRPVDHVDYLSPAQASAAAQGHLAYYRALERQGYARVITTRGDLDRHIREWEAWDSGNHPALADAPPLGVILSMESADPILRPEDLTHWWESGVRAIGPAHYGPGRYAGGTGSELGLTSSGLELLAEMARLGVVLDVTHLSDQSFEQALDCYGGPILASHNNCRSLVPHQRQFDHDQIRAIVARDGVIGVAFDAWMLTPGWTHGVSTNRGVGLTQVVDHIDHICQVAGGSGHVAIGSDLDGGFGREQSPYDLDTIADLQQLNGLLSGRGYGQADVEAILHGNWLRLLRRVLPADV